MPRKTIAIGKALSSETCKQLKSHLAEGFSSVGSRGSKPRYADSLQGKLDKRGVTGKCPAVVSDSQERLIRRWPSGVLGGANIPPFLVLCSGAGPSRDKSLPEVWSGQSRGSATGSCGHWVKVKASFSGDGMGARPALPNGGAGSAEVRRVSGESSYKLSLTSFIIVRGGREVGWALEGEVGPKNDGGSFSDEKSWSTS